MENLILAGCALEMPTRGAAEAWGNDPKTAVVWSQKNKGPGLKASSFLLAMFSEA